MITKSYQNVVWPVLKYSTEDFGPGHLMVCDEVKLGDKHIHFLCVQWRLHYDFIFCGWLAGWLGGLHIQSGF